MAYFYANPNPKKKLVIDCVIRAVSIVTDRSWHDVFFDICAEGGVLCDMPSSNLVWKKYLEEKGFTMDNIPNTCPDCYTVRDFTRDHPSGRYILGTGSHAIAVIDGNYYDTWDSGDEVLIFYFYKER